jgi:hypothetical protein
MVFGVDGAGGVEVSGHGGFPCGWQGSV